MLSVTSYSSRNGYTGEIVLKQPWPENAQEDKRGAIRARRTRLQSGLLEKVPQGTIQFSKKLLSLEDLGDDGARLRFEDGTEAVADLVVGAEGIRSVCWHNLPGKRCLANGCLTGGTQNFVS